MRSFIIQDVHKVTDNTITLQHTPDLIINHGYAFCYSDDTGSSLVRLSLDTLTTDNIITLPPAEEVGKDLEGSLLTLAYISKQPSLANTRQSVMIETIELTNDTVTLSHTPSTFHYSPILNYGYATLTVKHDLNNTGASETLMYVPLNPDQSDTSGRSAKLMLDESFKQYLPGATLRVEYTYIDDTVEGSNEVTEVVQEVLPILDNKITLSQPASNFNGSTAILGNGSVLVANEEGQLAAYPIEHLEADTYQLVVPTDIDLSGSLAHIEYLTIVTIEPEEVPEETVLMNMPNLAGMNLQDGASYNINENGELSLAPELTDLDLEPITEEVNLSDGIIDAEFTEVLATDHLYSQANWDIPSIEESE